MLRIISIILLFINGIAAGLGGWVLVMDPSGKAMQLPLEYLKFTPFDSYFIPGLILFTVLGFGSLAAGVLAIFRNKYYSLTIVAEGAVIVIWIVTQIIMIRVLFILQCIIGGIGLLLLIFGIILYHQENKPKPFIHLG